MTRISSLLQKALVSVQNIRNCYAPINRLPPEILGHIFRDVRDSRQDTYKTRCYGLRSQVPGEWGYVMLVCRHWRKIALYNPRMWSFVRVDLGRVFEPQEPGCKRIRYPHALNFRRSGDVPLAVECDIDRNSLLSKEFHPRLKYIVRHARRIQNLRLFISWKHSGQLRDLNYLVSPVCYPSLDVLQVTVFSGSSFETDVAQPLHFFRHLYSPRIRTVFVEGFTGWLSGSLSTLRNLCISRQSFSDKDLVRLLEVLAENPRLEDLALCEMMYLEGDLPLRHWTKVSMPSLKRVIIKQSDTSIYDVVDSALSLPVTTARQYSDPSVLWTRMLPTTADRLCLFYRTLVIATGPSAVSLTGYLNKPLFVPQANLIRELSLGAFSKAAVGDFVAFRHMEKVHVLTVQGCEFAKWIALALQDGPMVFPALTELRILTPVDSSGAPLLKYLLHRKRRGIGIDRLRIVALRGSSENAKTFLAWRRSCWKFLRAVPNVSFDLVEHLSLIELPDVCTDESLVHTFWEPNLWGIIPPIYY